MKAVIRGYKSEGTRGCKKDAKRQLNLKIINDLRQKIFVNDISTKYSLDVSFVEQFIQS